MDGAVLRDVAYDRPVGVARLLDLYLPAGGRTAAPLVIWSSGSAWLRDDGKEGAVGVAAHFVAAGYAVAGVSVRSSVQGRFPAQLEDGRAAVRWLRAHADEHRLDPARFAVMGNSSGGWLAAMLALTGGASGQGGAAAAVHAAVDFFGPTDFLQMDAHMPPGCVEFRARLGIDGGHADPGSPESRLVGGPIAGRRDACAAASPVAHVHPDAPPFLIVHGRDDPFVPHHQSELLYAALRDGGAEATFYSIPGVGHELPYVTDADRAAGYTVQTTAGGGPQPPPTWETIERFLAGAFDRRRGPDG